jgi:hypothetical protein
MVFLVCGCDSTGQNWSESNWEADWMVYFGIFCFGYGMVWLVVGMVPLRNALVSAGWHFSFLYF